MGSVSRTEVLLIFILSVMGGLLAVMVTGGGLHRNDEVSTKIKPSSSYLVLRCVLGGCKDSMVPFLHTLGCCNCKNVMACNLEAYKKESQHSFMATMLSMLPVLAPGVPLLSATVKGPSSSSLVVTAFPGASLRVKPVGVRVISNSA